MPVITTLTDALSWAREQAARRPTTQLGRVFGLLVEEIDQLRQQRDAALALADEMQRVADVHAAVNGADPSTPQARGVRSLRQVTTQLRKILGVGTG